MRLTFRRFKLAGRGMAAIEPGPVAAARLAKFMKWLANAFLNPLFLDQGHLC